MSELNARAVLGIRDFRLVWVAQTISDLGDGLTNLALLLVVNALTGSTAALALMAIVLAVPPMTIGLLAGVYVDRLDRRRLMLAADALRMVLVLGFVVVRSADQLWILYVLGFLEATVGTFFTPARIALVPTIVPERRPAGRQRPDPGHPGHRRHDRRGRWPASCSAVRRQCLAGVHRRQPHLRDLVPARPPGAGRAAAPPHPVSPHDRAAPRHGRACGPSWATGSAIIGRSPVLVGTLVSVGVLMLGLGAVNVLFIPLLIGRLHVSATWVGLVDLAQTSSMILSAVLVSALARRVRPTSVVTIALAGIAVMVLLLAGVSALWQVLLLLFLVGWLVSPLSAAASTIIQTSVADTARGRVGAALNAITSAALDCLDGRRGRARLRDRHPECLPARRVR